MTNENPIETKLPSLENKCPIMEPPCVLTSEESAPVVQPIYSQDEANRIAIVASASYHLTHLHKISMAVSESVANIMQNTIRTTNWTLEETKEIWDRVESELKTAL